MEIQIIIADRRPRVFVKEHEVEGHSDRPDVYLSVVGCLAVRHPHFWSLSDGSADFSLGGVCNLGEPKVRDHSGIAVVNQNIGRLDVSVEHLF